MTVRELRNLLADQPGDAEVQPSQDITLYIFDDQLGIVAEIEIKPVIVTGH